MFKGVERERGMRKDEFDIVEKHVGKEINSVLDEISGEIEGLTHLEMCGVVTPLVNGDRVLEIIEKHRRE